MEKPLHVEESVKQQQSVEEHRRSREVIVDYHDQMMETMTVIIVTMIIMERMTMIIVVNMIIMEWMPMMIILAMIITFATSALFTRLTRAETRHQAHFRW